MSTPLWITSDESAAHEIARHLIALGVPTQDIHIVQFAPPQDQEKRVGTFDNEDARGQRVGAFDNADARHRPQGSYDDTQHHQHTQEEPHTGRYDDTDLPAGFPQPQRYLTYDAAAQALVAAGIAPETIPPETPTGYTAITLPTDAPYLSEIEQALRHHNDQPRSAANQYQ